MFMSGNRYSSKHPVDNSNKKSVDPSSAKLPILEYTSNPISATEYKFTVQTKVGPSIPADAPTQFTLGQQRRTSLPMSKPIGKLVSGPDKKDRPSSPIHDDKLNLPVNPGVADGKHDKASTLVRDHGVETKNNKPLDDKSGKATDPVKDSPEQVEFKAEVSRPTKPGLLSNKNWRNIGGNQDLDKPNIAKGLISDKYTGAIDSREAQTRYGNSNPSERPSVNYTGTISSLEAARKYGGTPV